MRQKDKLYRINRPAIVTSRSFKNVFDGYQSSQINRWNTLAQEDYKNNPWNYSQDYLYGNGPSITDQYKASKNWMGLSKENNPFSQGNLSINSNPLMDTSGGKGTVYSAFTGLYGIADNIGNNTKYGKQQSDTGIFLNAAGDALGSTIAGPFLKAGAALANAYLGSAMNEGGINQIKADTNTIYDSAKTVGSSMSTNSFLQNYKNASHGHDFVRGDVGVEGPASTKVKREYERLQLERERALNTLAHSVGVGADNARKTTHELAMSGFYSYGGPLGFSPGALGLMQNNAYLDTIDRRTDAIAKNTSLTLPTTTPSVKFADGGQMKAAFLDSFKSDPIGAAVRYNQGIEQLAAQREAAEAEAAREKEYAAMQQRLANLETQNQGLQALMAAQSVPSVPEIPNTPEAPASSSTPSRAAYNSNWDYIEDQLRRSGRFNDVQIQGIKYNLQRESGIGRYDGGDNGTARGLAQWRGDRIPSDMSLEGQTQYLIDTLSNYDGKLHWIGRGNYEGFLNARTPEEAHYYIAKGYERPHRDIVAKVKRDSDMSLKRLNAFGGELGTNGTDFTNGLLYIDEGGSHEDNPLDGVPIGVDAEGIPNLVEEGETVYNDYVFSDRMKVPAFMYKELGLGGVVKKKSDKTMSFADASKKLAQESEQRPNDPLSISGLNAALAKLAEVQESVRLMSRYSVGGIYDVNENELAFLRNNGFEYEEIR